ncbi:uncharacterized protein LOC143294179 [Babylonia areolata]|uniref:uncharacterized protein LOC143294179 n=1 Tax=Babylonia areolata TaxID=304850 RepID=UPI003FD27651
MASSADIALLNTSFRPLTANEYTSTRSIPANSNTSSGDDHDECIKVVFSLMEYIPWNNPDNIISAEVENVTRRVKDTLVTFLFLIGGPANVINMAVFYKQGLKDRVNVCLFALALADELYLIMGVIYFGEQLHIQFTTGERFGPIMTFLANNHFTGLLGFGYVSNVLSTIIASERCHCVLNPLSYHTLMRTRTMTLIVVITYVTVLGLYFVVTFRYRVGCLHDPVSGFVVNTAVTGEFYERNKEFIDLLHGLCFGVGLPWVLIVVVAVTTAVTVVKLRQSLAWRAGSSRSLSSKEVGLTKMLIANSCFFLACIFPISLMHVTWMMFPEMNTGRRQHNFFMTSLWVTQGITFINATFNFFVYYAMGSRYRETFWALFGTKTESLKS